MDRLLKGEDVAELFGLKIPTVYSWVRRAQIPHIRLGRLIRLKLDGVLFRGSTRQTNKREAERVQSAKRTDLARRQRLGAKGEGVFPSPRNAEEHIRDFGMGFEQAAKQAGLPGVPPHYLRHPFMTWLENGEQRRSVLLTLRGHTRESHGDPYLHPDWKDKVAAIERLPLPAKFTTVTEASVADLESKDEQVQVPEELGMVGPWGLEPQTSTIMWEAIGSSGYR